MFECSIDYVRFLSFERKLNVIGSIIIAPFIGFGIVLAVIGGIIALPFSYKE